MSSPPEGNGLTSLCLFLLPHLLSQLLWVQTHSSSGPCKQPMIWLQTSYGHKAQTLVLSTGRSRWSISLIMWKVAIKSARCVTRSCLQPKSESHTSGQLIVIALPTSVQPAPNHLETHMHYLSTGGFIQHQLGSTYVLIVEMPISPTPN